ncbi:MAG: response regulator [Thermodesulfovibrionales bacterium]|nr:response regulator [Thermodesulfovibrionales bacterium]
MNNLTFIIVDDSNTVRRLVRKIIETKIGSNNIYEASTGEEALKIIKEKQVDIIISDWDMPNMTGDELLYEIKNNPKTKHIPFIMMTTHGEKDFIITAIQLGVSHYLVKPFTPQELEDSIRKSWNSATKRSAPRYASLPPHTAIIRVNDTLQIPAFVVNISRTGVLLKALYNREVYLFSSYNLFLKVEKTSKQDYWIVGPINGKVVRLEADSSTENHALIAMFFDPKHVNKEAEKTFLAFLKWLNSRTPDSIPAE